MTGFSFKPLVLPDNEVGPQPWREIEVARNSRPMRVTISVSAE